MTGFMQTPDEKHAFQEGRKLVSFLYELKYSPKSSAYQLVRGGVFFQTNLI